MSGPPVLSGRRASARGRIHWRTSQEGDGFFLVAILETVRPARLRAGLCRKTSRASCTTGGTIAVLAAAAILDRRMILMILTGTGLLRHGMTRRLHEDPAEYDCASWTRPPSRSWRGFCSLGSSARSLGTTATLPC